MIADDLAVAQVVVLLDQTVVQGFKVGMSNHLKLDIFKIRNILADRVFVNFNEGDITISVLVNANGFGRWKRNQFFTEKCQQDFPASHIFESAVGLYPVPLLAQDSGDMGSALVPVLVNGGLNQI